MSPCQSGSGHYYSSGILARSSGDSRGIHQCDRPFSLECGQNQLVGRF